jgi:hypothetical protein
VGGKEEDEDYGCGDCGEALSRCGEGGRERWSIERSAPLHTDEHCAAQLVGS